MASQLIIFEQSERLPTYDFYRLAISSRSGLGDDDIVYGSIALSKARQSQLDDHSDVPEEKFGNFRIERFVERFPNLGGMWQTDLAKSKQDFYILSRNVVL